MSCACENKRLGGDLDRITRLAKALAVTEGKTVAIFKKDDGTYDFLISELVTDPASVIEYVSKY